MAKKLDILIFPDPRLRKVAEKVTKFDKCLEKLAQNMLETMYEANGIGLAATQVDKHIHRRVFWNKLDLAMTAIKEQTIKSQELVTSGLVESASVYSIVFTVSTSF